MVYQTKLKNIVSDNSFPFRIDYGILNEDYEAHSHDFHELFIITKGTAIHTVNNNKQQITAGDVFVFNNSTIQHSFTDTGQLELYNFIFSPEYFFDQQDDLFQMEGYQSLFVLDPFFSSKKGYENFVHLPYQELMEMMMISETILNEFKVKPSGYKTIIKSKFLELVVKLSRSYFCHVPNKKTPHFQGISKAITYIEKNYTKPIYNEDLANMASLSTRQFLRIFKECYQSSPVNYIIQLRLKHACNLLKTIDLSLKDIAYDCGFSDANYFSRLFSTHIGESPSEYRKKYLCRSNGGRQWGLV